MSQYRPLTEFPKKWIFFREDPKVTEQDHEQILFLTETAAGNIWRDYVSDDHLFPELLTSDHWIKQNLQGRCQWESVWESDSLELPDDISAHVAQWGDDTKVWFALHSDVCFETTFGVFKRNWKAFLFLDSDPVLLGRKKKQAVQFHSDGTSTLTLRP